MLFRITGLLLLSAAWFIHAAIPTADTVTNYRGIKFKRIPAGTFQMGFEGRTLTGSAAYGSITQGFSNEYPCHKVTITRDFYMGMYEVTRHQYYPTDGSSKPMGWMTWAAANAFCDTLTAHDPNGWTYRLPTEAEWEYCCRAGTTTWFYPGDAPPQANFGPVAEVGGYASNPWGLYDMAGNAEEWCFDWLNEYPPQADSLVNPGGSLNGTLKCVRSLSGHTIYARSAARGALPPVLEPTGQLGFRVVISDLTRDSLRYTPRHDTLALYQLRVAQSRPAPLAVVSGENYTDGEGSAFKKVRMTRSHYPTQKDSVVYVSLNPVAGDSAASRRLAGLYARRLSGTHGVLYRLANRYELSEGGITAATGGYHLTILPDIKFTGNQPHPDASYMKFRITPMIPEVSIGGTLYSDCNNNAYVSEAPNGDILGSWYSGIGEDGPAQVTAGVRLRLGEDAWDTAASQVIDFPGYVDYGNVFWDNGKGVLYNYHGTQGGVNYTWKRKSMDNGVTWGAWEIAFPNLIGKSLFRLGGDTIVSLCDISKMALSPDDGETWTLANPVGGAFHTSGVVTDEDAILGFQRGVMVKNSDSVVTQYSAISTDKGMTWTPLPTPFYPPGIGNYNVALKLHSGRLLFALHCHVPDKDGVILAESEDDGRTWFCRRKFGDAPGGTGDDMGGYMDMCQGRDGIIHLLGTHGSCGPCRGDNPQASFSEQWLREGTCLDVSDWGINTAGMVKNGCPDEDSMPPLDIGAAAKVGASLVGAPTLTAMPNPFNPSTTLHYSLPGNGALALYDIDGRLVRSFVISGGKGMVDWDGNDGLGRQVSAGLYFVRMKAGQKAVETKTLLKLH